MDKYLSDLLKTMLNSFLEHPESANIDAEISPRGICVKLDVHPSDMGLVIGKRGQMFQSLRSILRAAGSKAGSIVNFVVAEPTK